MAYQSRVPRNRSDVDLTAEQAAVVARVDRGASLSGVQRGMLHAAVTYANRDAAATAEAALDKDAQRQNGRGVR